jgi:hypothetical protein
MLIKIIKSPKSTKKFRTVFEDKTYVDFGANGYSDYTLHKNPMRMRLYVKRHGGKIKKDLMNEINPSAIQNKMLNIIDSYKEDWSISGIKTAGFWSRWYLWSYPSRVKAKQFIEKKFKLKIKIT